jgi:copper chaperone
MEKAELIVDGMKCGHCKMAVEKALNGLEGVASVKVDLTAKSVAVEFDGGKVSLDEIREAIADEGYEVKS